MKEFATITVIGQDKTGVVAKITNFLFLQKANIEALEEQVTRGQFSMTLQTSWRESELNQNAIASGLPSSPPIWKWRLKFDSPNPAVGNAWPLW
jgi:formyltetrahydrofolate deformylase